MRRHVERHAFQFGAMDSEITFDLREEAKEFRAWVEAKVADPARLPTSSVGAIVCLYNYDQSGWIAIDFNADEPYEPDCDVSTASWDDLFDRPTWRKLYEAFADSDDSRRLAFIEADGVESAQTVTDWPAELVSSHLGKMIRHVLLSCWTDGVFVALPLRAGCAIEIWDFMGDWGWGAREQAGHLVEE
jgi:hypothetical protein